MLSRYSPGDGEHYAKIACGTADDSLTCTVLATEARSFWNPSMNDNMDKNPLRRENSKVVRNGVLPQAVLSTAGLATGKSGRVAGGIHAIIAAEQLTLTFAK
jgi:hypothetical protein